VIYRICHKDYFSQPQTVVETYNKALGSERSTGEPTTPQVEWVWLSHQAEVVGAKVHRTIPGDREDIPRSEAEGQRRRGFIGASAPRHRNQGHPWRRLEETQLHQKGQNNPLSCLP
ncbi:hypothetical protein AMECASPLE_034513, partial [Ameca splendens]